MEGKNPGFTFGACFRAGFRFCVLMLKPVCMLRLVLCQELLPMPGGALFITQVELTFSSLHHCEFKPPAVTWLSAHFLLTCTGVSPLSPQVLIKNYESFDS